MFGLRKKKVEAPALRSESDNSSQKKNKLIIHVGEASWVARILSPDTHKTLESFKSIELDVEGNSSERTEKNIRIAFQTIPETSLKDVGEILLLLDDSKVVISDYGPDIPEGISPGGIRDFAQQRLNVKEASFGSMMYGSEDDQKQIFAFIDVDDLRRYLGALDQHATLISKVIPSPFLFFSRAQKQPNKVHATLHMSDMSSSFVAIDKALGQVFVRTIPIGTVSLVTAIAEKMGISLSDAQKGMAKQNYVKDLRLGEHLKPEDEILLSSYGKVLRPLLNEVVENVSESIAYFEAQKLGGMIEFIEIFGDLSAIRGLDSVIEKSLFVPGKIVSEMPVDLLCNEPETATINLLAGSTGNLFSVGKVKYTFSESRIISSTKLATRKGTLLQKAKKKVRKLRNTNPESAHMMFGIDISKFMEMLNTIAFEKITFEKNKSSDTFEQTLKEDRMFFSLFGLFMVAVLYVGWTYLDEAQTKYANTSAGISQKLKNNAVLRNRIAPPEMSTNSNAKIQTVDKVLWAEKFLSIADNMDNAMWISDIYLGDDTRIISGNTVRSKKLTIEGAVLPSTIGHILEISEYIKRLENDKASFMADFSDITFGGAHIDTTDQEHIVRFTINAWYDKNKRQKPGQ
ncbi:MAG: hypothetical protein COB46_05910 [Rhodospirillaceae bacterium]|nr:MAG: hypothetical protein COB46_05910 [Rhodospirillaceae bacterium]